MHTPWLRSSSGSRKFTFVLGSIRQDTVHEHWASTSKGRRILGSEVGT
jgi:hypothetical protein